MKMNQWIISLVIGILMFLAVFYIGKATFLPALFCGVLGFVCNAFVSWNANRNN
ncbi:hypothetical protein MTR00_11905 [Staphylococcus agnetis]|uniref:hypothetical protein n=1 Tax=Staphylococcus agnetis TaxID=985762 RepID=UPI00208EF967|nr:hypothetical protein [Staphylococcus agnetis]MCO4353935.1 hypothetical protein [Staphylococcus agnetis]MCO4370444.1 hypothetical protein [Staphylococcus agnetis]